MGGREGGGVGGVGGGSVEGGEFEFEGRNYYKAIAKVKLLQF